MIIGVTSPTFSNNKDLVKILKKKNVKKIILSKKKLSQKQLAILLSKCDRAIVGTDKINNHVLNKTKKLKIISKFGVGIDNINFQHCHQKNIKVNFTPGVNKIFAAEISLGYIICLKRNINKSSNFLKQGTWHKNGGSSLFEKKLGIIGLGNIGKSLVKLVRPFKMNIYANDIKPDKLFAKKNKVKLVSKNYIYKNCEIISLHLPLTLKTKNLINNAVLKKINPKAILINTARGEIVNFKSLIKHLDSKSLQGAAIDVYEKEPFINKKMLKNINLISTAHIAGNSQESIYSMGISAIKNLKL